ncbi:Ig-like domain-containing protein, partial [Flavobacterium sp. FlaQc-47]|uniref:Ig-like domain-containing protein n=1 Tax=Flavobacterium sp. FlaQc-47 TaxID=3374180 RepID=UPI003756F414
MKKAICLFFLLFIFSQISNAQCASPIVGCSTTDLSNFGFASNNNAATIEYDNFVSSWHTTVVRISDGSFQVWGEKIASDGVANLFVPKTIDAANFPGLTGTPIKAGLGSTSQNNLQGIVLATDGLYAWSTEGIILDGTITSSAAFQKLTIGGNSTGLPAGITPGDVKMMFTTSKTLAITTCSGEVWVISQTPTVRGNGTTANGGTSNATTWYRVTTSAAGNPFLTDVVACRGNVDGLMALKSDGTVYVWGTSVLLGNNTAIATQTRATQMTIPAGKTVKMIGSTGTSGSKSYYILATDGNLYGVGENTNKELGDWTTTDRTGWVQPRYSATATDVMNNIKWFSSQEHDSQYGAINVINNNKKLYAFGNNNNSLLGRVGTPSDPGTPGGILSTDDIIAVETGGHTSMIVKSCETKFGYVGHRTNGSMGNGATNTAVEANYTFATAAVQICGAESTPAIQPISTGGGPDSKYCVGDPVLLNPTPTGGTLSVLSGPGTLTGSTLNFTAAGTVVVQYSVATTCGTSVTSRSFDAALCPIDLEITKTVDNVNASVGTNSTFTITAKNNGPYKATGVTVNDVLPAGYTFVSATPSAGTWTAPNWAVGTLTNGTSVTLSIVATVNPSGPYANTATVSGNDPDTNSANNTATATPVVQSNLSVTKTASTGTHDVGTNVTFTITASNAGPSNATGVKVSDALPAGYTFVSATPSTGTWLAPDWTIGNLGNGATATLSIVAKVNATGSYANTASITGTQNDPTPGNNSGSVTPTINHAPVATADSYTVAEGGTLNTAAPGVLANDTDIDGDAITAILVTGPANGTLTLNANGSFIYTHNGSETLSDSFTYKVNDGRLDGNTVTVTITVTPVNDNPVANNDTATINEDTAVTINVTTNDTDVDGTIDVATVDLDPATPGIQNTFTVTGQGTYTVNNLGVVTFTPVLNYNGTATPVNYTVNDNNGAVSNIATISITVTAVNDNPVANNDTVTTNEDTAVTINVTTNDTDVDGTIDVATVDLDPATPGIQNTFTVTGQGTYTVNNLGVVTFTPVLNYNGTATPVNYTVNDNNGAVSNIATISVTVTSVNDNPVANNDTVTTNEDTAVTINITTNDTDVDGTIDVATVDLDPATPGIQNTFTVTGQGTYTVNNLGVVTFTPVLNYNGTATPVNYTVNDNNGAVSNIATISITITAVNDNPVANNDTVTTNEDTVVTINITTNDTDVDGTIDVATVDLDPATPGIQNTFRVTGQGTYTVNNLGVVTFTPVLNYNGTATPVNYTVNDNNGAVSNIATISITVTAVNDNPIANNDTATTNEDTAVTINVTTNDTDVDGTIDVATVDLDPATPGIQNTFTVTGQGTYTVNNLGVVTFTPVLNYNGTATPVNYTVNDNNGAVSNIATISITVTAVNDNPVANNDTATTNEDTAVTINITTNDTDVDGTIDVATVDLDPATPGIQNTFTVTGQGTYTVNNLGVVTFTPVLNYNGTATPINYTVNDNNGAVSNIATISITITAVNDNPVANNDTATTNEDTAVTINITTNDTDVDGTIDVATVDLDPATPGIQNTFTVIGQGTYTVNNLGVVTFTPVLNYNGTATPINYTVNDNNGAVSNIATISITVTAVNDNPVANNDTATTNEDTAVTINVTTNDTDVDGTIDVATVDLDPATPGIQNTFTVTGQGTYTVNNLGVVTFTPVLNYNGTATPINYTVNDNNGAVSNIATISITITAVNDNPVANNDTVTTNEDTAVTINVTTNDTDVDGTIDVATVDLDPATPGIQNTFTVTGQGTYTVNNLGVVTFTPVLNYNGTATPVNYTINDNNGAVSNIATISITVTAVNDNPVANNDTATTNEDTAVTINVTTNDTDVDGTIDVATVDLDPATPGIQNTFTVTGQGTYTVNNLGVVTFTPVLNYNGTATPINYTVNDNNGAVSNIATISVTVTSVNDNPVANNDTVTTNEDTAVTINITTNDTDVDGTIDVATVDLDPATPGIQTTFTVTGQGTYTVNNLGVVTFTPVLNYNGTATPINYTVNDNNGAVSNIATISITITAVNDNPVAVDDVYTVAEDGTVTLTPLALDSDVDGDTLSITSINGTVLTGGIQTINVSNGTVNISATGVITFTPALNFNSATPISISYVISDGNGGTATANELITVTAVNDNPVAVDDVYTVAEDNTITLTPLVLDSDVDGDTLSITSINGTVLTGGIQTINVSNGTVNISATGVITFTPALNFNSATPISISYVISDGNGGTATANELITVTSINDNPVAVDDVYTVAEDGTVTLTPLALDSDVDGDTLSITSINGTVLTGGIQTINVTNGTVNISATGVITFTPALNFNSATPISIPYVISDGNGGTAAANQVITVTSVNDNPVAVDDVYTVAEDGTVTLTPLALDSDVDGDTLSITSINGTVLTGGIQTINVSNGTVNISATGVITFTPALNFNSVTPISIPYVISDGNGGTATANELITVTAVNDNPVAVDDVYTVAEDNTITLTPLALDSDVDGDTLSITSINGTVLTGGIQTINVSNGTVNISATGVITFTPALNFNSATPISIPYVISDGNGGTAMANELITVTSVNDNPVAVDDAYTVAEDGTITLTPLALDSDVDGDTLSITSINGTVLTGGIQTINVTNGTVNISATGVITFTPALNFNSATPISIPYVISDGNGGTAAANELITVTAVNDNPVAVDDVYTVAEDGTITLTPLALDSDVDGDTLSITSINGTVLTGGIQTINVSNGTVNISATGVITFTPALNFNSATPISIPYVISDGNGGTATANQIITVTSVNDNPVAVDDVYTVAEDGTVTLTPLVLDSDVDGDTLSITSINGTVLTGGIQTINVTNGTVNISATGVITFSPALNFNSATPISIPYVISDGNGGTATANQIITVTSVNDNPVAVDDVYTVAEDGTVTLTPLVLDSDV